MVSSSYNVWLAEQCELESQLEVTDHVYKGMCMIEDIQAID